jgi:hypothetical protein
MSKFKYPDRYELLEVLNTLPKSFLIELSQERGLFVTHVNHQQLADELANVYYDNQDLNKIRSEAYQKSSNHALSGFIVKSPKKDFDLKNIYQYIFDGNLQNYGQSLTAPRLVDKEKNIYKASIEYRKIKPGRIAFLQDETTSFDFYMEDKGNGIWQIEIDSNRSTDSKELQELLNKGLQSDVELEELEQDYLTDDKSVNFFDELVGSGMSSSWKISDIKHLTLRKGNDLKETDEENTKEADEEQLIGISQAVLEGKGLRENSFVKQSVHSGYRFTAMTYEFQNVGTPEVLTLKAEFKGRPKVFEVSIVSASENFDISLSRRPAQFSTDENRLIRSEFWNNARAIYNKLRAPEKK